MHTMMGSPQGIPSGNGSVSDFDVRMSTLCGKIDGLEQRVFSAETRAHAAEEDLGNRVAAAEQCAVLAEGKHIAVSRQLESVQVDLRRAATDFLTMQDIQLEQQQRCEELDELNVDLMKKNRRLESVLADMHELHVVNELERKQMERSLAQEQVEKAHLYTSLMTVKVARDDAQAEVAATLADMQAMQAALLDSALYVRFLRARLIEAQLDQGSSNSSFPSNKERHDSDPHGCENHQEDSNSTFSFAKTKEAVQGAVLEASLLPASERAKRLKILRLRWHPDKNPVLQEFATEVTKIINEAVGALPVPDADP